MTTPAPTDDTVLEANEIDLSLFWHQNKRKILLGALAVLAVVGGSLAWYVSSVLSTRASEAALSGATDAVGFASVAKEYRGTSAAASATMLLASALRDEGKMSESTAAFEQFLKSYPKHSLAGGALLGIAQNQDASGDAAAAAATYGQVAERYPASYAAPFASYALAEIHLRDFRRSEARALFEAIQAEAPDSVVARLAAAQMSRLGASQAK